MTASAYNIENELPRTCRRCSSLVEPERHQVDNGITWLWRCACGWSNARTQTGVSVRRRALEAIAKASSELEDERPD